MPWHLHYAFSSHITVVASRAVCRRIAGCRCTAERAAAAASRRVVAETCGCTGDNCGSISIADNCGRVAVSSFAAGGAGTPYGSCMSSLVVLAINCCCIARGLGGWDWEPRVICRYDSSRRRSTSSSTAVSMSWFSRSSITPHQPRTGSATRRLDS